MMRPPSVMRFAACWEPHHLVFMFSASCSSNFSMEMSGRAYILRSRLPPALLTMMSRRPKSSTTWSSTLGMAVKSITSAETPSPRWPRSSISLATASTSCWRRANTTTSAPQSARARAMPRPMPRPPPVTTATLPSSRNSSCMPIAILPKKRSKPSTMRACHRYDSSPIEVGSQRESNRDEIRRPRPDSAAQARAVRLAGVCGVSRQHSGHPLSALRLRQGLRSGTHRRWVDSHARTGLGRDHRSADRCPERPHPQPVRTAQAVDGGGLRPDDRISFPAVQPARRRVQSLPADRRGRLMARLDVDQHSLLRLGGGAVGQLSRTNAHHRLAPGVRLFRQRQRAGRAGAGRADDRVREPASGGLDHHRLHGAGGPAGDDHGHPAGGARARQRASGALADDRQPARHGPQRLLPAAVLRLPAAILGHRLGWGDLHAVCELRHRSGSPDPGHSAGLLRL